MAEPEKDQIAPRKSPRVARYVIAAVAVVGLGIVSYFVWRYVNTYETTDDAQIDGHINASSGRITGTVTEVRADDAQYVKAGDVLLMLDPRDYEVALAKAQADLGDAEAALESSRMDVPILTTNTASQLKTATSSRAHRRVWILRKPRSGKPRRTSRRPATT